MGLWHMKRAAWISAKDDVNDIDAKNIYRSLRRAAGLFQFVLFNTGKSHEQINHQFLKFFNFVRLEFFHINKYFVLPRAILPAARSRSSIRSGSGFRFFSLVRSSTGNFSIFGSAPAPCVIHFQAPSSLDYHFPAPAPGSPFSNSVPGSALQKEIWALGSLALFYFCNFLN